MKKLLLFLAVAASPVLVSVTGQTKQAVVASPDTTELVTRDTVARSFKVFNSVPDSARQNADGTVSGQL